MTSPQQSNNRKNLDSPKNLGIDFEEQIIWFQRNNENNSWEIHKPPSLTTRGKEFIEKFEHPDPLEEEEWPE